MLVKPQQAQQALTKLDPSTRLYLFGGPDESASRALRDQIARTIGADSERVDISPSRARDDPALLSDEAASISLFGGVRWIFVGVMSGSGDELIQSVENLLAAPAAGNPVVITVAGLTGKSRLTKIVTPDPGAMIVISYPPNAADAGKLAQDLAAPLGLSLDPDLTSAIVQATGGDRGLMAREIEKLALYCDASPSGRGSATVADWQAIGAGVDGEDLSETINAVFGGHTGRLPQCMAELDAFGALDIRLVRSLASRALLLARLRVLVDAGTRASHVVDAQGNAIFWKEREAVARQLERWTAPYLARAMTRLHRLERDLKAPDSPKQVLVRQALVAMANAGGRKG